MELNAIYHNMYNVLYNYLKECSWKTVDEQNIEEIINKTFFEFHKKTNNNYNITNVKKYLCRIAYNVMRNSYSYKKRYYDKNIELLDYELYSNKLDILDIVIKKEQLFIIKLAIDSLENIEKNVIILYYFHDLNYRQISTTLFIKYSKVSKILNNALNNLKRYLESIEYDSYL